MSEKLTACKDCAHHGYLEWPVSNSCSYMPADYDRIRLEENQIICITDQCFAPADEHSFFDAYEGIIRGKAVRCGQINTNGHCPYFKPRSEKP